MGRQLNQIIEGLAGVTSGTSTINVNLDAIEALLTTLQADVADGLLITNGTGSLTGGTLTTGTLAQVTGGTLNSNLRDGSGNAITSTTSGASRRLDVMLSSGGTNGSAAPTNANLVGGTDGTNLRAFSTDTAGRVNVNPVNQNLTTGSGSVSGTSVLNTDILASTDVSGFAEATIQFTGSWPSSGIVTTQTSNDNLTWVNHPNVAIGSTSPSNTISGTGIYRISLSGARYLRVRITNAGTNNSYDYAYTLNPRTSTFTTQPVAIVNSTALSITPSTGNGFSTHHTAISAASTNATNVKSSAPSIGSIIVSNTSSSIRYFKIFNLSVAPTMGTSSPVLNYAIMPNSTMAIDCGFAGIRLSAGLSYAITSGQALLDNTAVGAGDVVVNISYA